MKHIDTWYDVWSAYPYIGERIYEGTPEYDTRIKFCGESCYHSYVSHTRPHEDGECEPEPLPAQRIVKEIRPEGS